MDLKYKIFIYFIFMTLSMSAKVSSLAYIHYDHEDKDSIYVVITNASDSTICLLDAYGKQPLSNNDQMLYLHRYNPRTGIFALSFLPIMPFLKYYSSSSESQAEWQRYQGEPAQFYPIYKFRLIPSKQSYVFPISKASVFSTEYIEEYYPYLQGYYNDLFMSSDRKLRKYKEYRPFIGKLGNINKYKYRDKNWIMLEFAIWQNYDIITKAYPHDENSINWSFIYDPINCNKQLHEYITLSMPIIINEWKMIL